MTLFQKVNFQLRVVENLAVIDYPESFIFVADGLYTAADAYDAQPAMAKCNVIIDINAGFIRATIVNC